LGALLPLVDAADTMLKGWDHFLAQGPLYVATGSIFFILSLMAAFVKKERIHAAFGILFMVYMLVFISINLKVLS
jgi:drug/metabolite transporter superfamily protein YnfA